MEKKVKVHGCWFLDLHLSITFAGRDYKELTPVTNSTHKQPLLLDKIPY